jgi:sensor histidine kinase YesM
MASASLPPDLAATFELSSKRRLRVLCSLWAMFFLLLLITELQDHWDHVGVRWWEPIVWIGTSGVVASLWLIAYWRDRRHSLRYLGEPARWLWRQLRWFPPVAVVFVMLTYGLRHGIYALLGLEYRHESWTFVFIYEAVKLWLFLGLWLGILFALESFDHWQREQRRLAELQRSLAQAQLLQLQNQLRPHFLFNALNTISSIMRVDVERADRLLSRLANFLRASLRNDQQEMTTLGAEIELLQLYAQIMEERFEDRVQVEWNIDPQALEASVPTMLLQPLLENAFKHGVQNTTSAVRICVSAQPTAEHLEIVVSNAVSSDVSDCGQVSPGNVSPVQGEGIGLCNTRSRLELHYGSGAQLDFQSTTGSATIRIRIPWPSLQ